MPLIEMNRDLVLNGKVVLLKYFALFQYVDNEPLINERSADESPNDFGKNH